MHRGVFPSAVQLLQDFFVNLKNGPGFPVSCGVPFIGRGPVLSNVYPNCMHEIGNQGSPASVHAQNYNYRLFVLHKNLPWN
jgi:hypothetical protein